MPSTTQTAPLPSPPPQSLEAEIANSKLVAEGVTVHLFETEAALYAYDGYSNQTLEIDALASALLAAVGRPWGGGDEDCSALRAARVRDVAETYGSELVQQRLRELEATRSEEEIFHSYPRDLAFELPDSQLQRTGRGRWKTLVLEITEACNFRCSYCIYSGSYPNEREHTTKHMEDETAFRAIDLFLAHANTQQAPEINFYGGEALIRKATVKACMEYARARQPDCEFSITTNAFLLDPDMRSLLLEFNVRLFVSVDGPKKIHDRFRVLASGKGTFDRVIGNLEALLEAEPEYFERNVHFTLVMSSSSEYEEIARFFNDRPIFKFSNLQVGTVTESGLSDQAHDRWKDPTLFQKTHTEHAKERYLQAVVNGEPVRGAMSNVNFEHQSFGKVMQKVAGRVNTRVEKTFVKSSPCEIGGLRMFVNAKGKVRNCEKTARLPVIGDVGHGFDTDAVGKIRNDLLGATEDCKTCFALHTCDVCYVHLYGDTSGEVDLSTKRKQCAVVRGSRHNGLVMLAEALERLHDSEEAGPE